MASDIGKALVRRAVAELFNAGDLTVADEVYAPAHERQFAAIIRTAFPDLVLTIEHLIAEGDLLATHWAASGTHQGIFQGIAPTGKQATWTGTWVQRVADGKIVEGMQWGNWDALGLLRQLAPQERAA
jgi:predicted ester cyclase